MRDYLIFRSSVGLTSDLIPIDKYDRRKIIKIRQDYTNLKI